MHKPALIFNQPTMRNRYTIEVNCYSGHTYAQRPQSFIWQGKRHEIQDVEKSWLEPEERHFLVHTTEKELFHLCYNEIHKEWTLIE